MATEFTPFPQLITELRLEIWRFALPDPDPSPTWPLFRYKKGCWVIEEIGPQWDGPDPNGENLQARFDTNQLEPLRIPLPLYCVNREAHGVAIKYLREHKYAVTLRTTSSGETRSCDILRPFNPRTDTIFLPVADAYAFGGEPGDRLHAPDMEDRYVSFPYAALPRLAVTPSGLEALKSEPLETFLTTGGMITMLYVVDVPATSTLTLQDLENEADFPLVGLEETSRAKVTWTHYEGEWTTSGDDCEARVRLREMVAGLEDIGTNPGDDSWDVRLVNLITT
jgi:hypothetical protein